MQRKKTLEDELYVIGWISLVLGGIGLFLYFKVLLPSLPVFPCMFLKLLGIYCPGCGGTRAVIAFLKGDFLMSLWYHPLVMYSVVLFGAFMISQTLERIGVPRVRGMKFYPWQLYGAVVIIVVNLIVKNILLLMFQITL